MKNEARPKRKCMRLSGWDYSRPGAYFVTLCAQNRAPILGDKHVQACVESWWLRLEEKFFQAGIDEFVIMPDHLHGIILIHDEPHKAALGSMIQWFKTMTTNAYIQGVRDENWPPFSGRLWQRGFYDRVIRNDQDLNRIRGYIRTNPEKLPGMG